MSKYKYKENNRPLFTIEDDEDNEESGIKLISLVEKPAIEMKGFCFSKQEDVLEIMQFKADKERKRIIGPAMIPDIRIPRKDESGEYDVMFTKDRIAKMVDKFNSSGNNRRLNFNHTNRMVDGFIAQNWIVDDPYHDKSYCYGLNVPEGTYMIEVKIEDDKFWENEVKDLGAYGFSIEGLMGTKKVQMSAEDIIDELSDEEVFELVKELKFQSHPPLHDNCQCKIIDGVWILGTSESGNCIPCLEASKKYNK